MLVVPTDMVPMLRDQRFAAAVPSLEIPISGTVTAPQINVGAAATNLIQRHLTQPDALKRLLERKAPAPPGAAPAPEPPPGTIGRPAPPAPAEPPPGTIGRPIPDAPAEDR
jgi:hypothetical protein